MRFICILTTAPRMAVARKIARGLLQKKLAACVTLIPGMESHYKWKGKAERSREVQLLIKTTREQFKKIDLFLTKNHPYEVPELISLSVQSISKKYAAWISDSLK